MKTRIYALLTLATAMLLAACGSTANPGTAEDRALLHSQSQATVNDFKRKDPTLERLLNEAQAYVIFPSHYHRRHRRRRGPRRRRGLSEGQFAGYADISQATIGLQLGGQKYAELILFRNEGTYADFTHSTYEMDAR